MSIHKLQLAYSRSRSFTVTRSKKGQTKNCVFGRRDTCFWVIFRQERENDPRTLFERLKADKFLKEGKCKNRREQREKWPYWPSKHQNSELSQDIYMKFCTHIHLAWFFHICFVFFLKIRQKTFFKCFFLSFKLFIIFKIFKIRDGSLIEMFILNLLLKTNRSYLLIRALEGGGRFCPTLMFFGDIKNTYGLIPTSFSVPDQKWAPHLLKKKKIEW